MDNRDFWPYLRVAKLVNILRSLSLHVLFLSSLNSIHRWPRHRLQVNLRHFSRGYSIVYVHSIVIVMYIFMISSSLHSSVTSHWMKNSTSLFMKIISTKLDNYSHMVHHLPTYPWITNRFLLIYFEIIKKFKTITLKQVSSHRFSPMIVCFTWQFRIIILIWWKN